MEQPLLVLREAVFFYSKMIENFASECLNMFILKSMHKILNFHEISCKYRGLNVTSS